MSINKLTKRYSESLLNLAVEEGQLERVYKDIEIFYNNCNECSDLYKLLKSPILKNDMKLKVLRKIYEKDFSKITMNFISLVMKKRREFYLKEIALSFINQYREYKNIVSAKLITAVEISDVVKDKIGDYVQSKSKKNVHLEHLVDEDMIGGFVLEFDDHLYDASISHQLNILKKGFNKNLYIIRFNYDTGKTR